MSQSAQLFPNDTAIRNRLPEQVRTRSRSEMVVPVGVLLAVSLLLQHASAPAETLFSVYGGTSFTRNSDLHIARPGSGTSLTVRDVEWGADPFKPAPYYGLRLTHFNDRYASWGVALDFTHYKMYAKTGQRVAVDGIWNGVPVNATEPMDRYAQRFEISHGVNVLSINGIYRILSTALAGDALQPYAGVGLAYYRPHSENTVDNIFHKTGYQASGFGYQLLGGLQYRMTERLGAFVEAKFNSGTGKVGIAGGNAETPLRTLHAIVGVNYAF